MEESFAELSISGNSNKQRFSNTQHGAPGVGNCMQGHTYAPVIQFSYMWTIHQFNLRHEKIGDALESPIFSAQSDDKFKWRLIIFPNGGNKQYKDYVSLYLQYVYGPKMEVQAIYKFSILNAKSQKTNTKDSVGTFFENRGKGWPDFMNTDSLLNQAKQLLPDNKLIIFCEVGMISDVDNDSNQPNAVEIPECTLLNDLRLMFENQRLSDVTFSVAGKEFQAHKAILAARSSVFQTMFELEMSEKKGNQVNISDTDHAVFQEMLRFIYTGKVINIESIASDLLVVADKYALYRLKAMCEDTLCNSDLSVENVAEILILADLHKVNKLKAQAIQFINAYAKEVMKTSGWKSIVQSHPEILEDLHGSFTLW